MTQQNNPDFDIKLSHARLIAGWLFIVCGMILAMIILGGMTRLTNSGLSMVNWQPITGWLPPMSDTAWVAIFEDYRLSPQYLEINRGMSVDEFKEIFWLEYIHRLWGRAIGVVFFLPFVFFVIRGWVDRRIAPALAFFFILGGLQGGLGWFMVKSGLSDNPEVSQYRLTAHLGLAVFIYGVMFRYGLRLRHGIDAVRPVIEFEGAKLRQRLVLLSALIFVTILSGGFVAGLDAGMTYNTFPLMDGQLIPDQLYDGNPFYISAFEDILTVQFNHRVLAITTLVVVILLWFRAAKINLRPRVRQSMLFVLLTAILQVALGITTLLMVVPVSVATIHQFGAIILLSTVLYALYSIEWNR